MEWLGLWLLNTNFIYMPETSLKTNKKTLLVLILFFAVISGMILMFQKNNLGIENDKSVNLRDRVYEIEDETNKDKIDNETMLSIADEDNKEYADNDENKTKEEKWRELKFMESVEELIIKIKFSFGFAENRAINPELEITELQKEARIIRVPEDYKSIQLAIDSAEAGDRIEVSAGEYQENIVMKEGVSLIGLSASADEADKEKKLGLEDLELNPFSSSKQAILDGGNFGNVVSFKNGISEKTELAGFIIKNAGKSLSGVFVENSSPFIHGNVFIDNEYGIYIKGRSSPIIQKNAIKFSNKGIEVYNFEKLEDFTQENKIGEDKQNGSSIQNLSYATILEDNGADNESEINNANPNIIDNLITDNKIGIDLYQSSAAINHNTISYNNHYKAYLGATYGIYLSKSSAEITNNIITDSGICELCAGVNADKESKNVVLRYNNIWNNKNNFVCFGECVMEENNISEEPMFIDCAGGNYKLSEESPLTGKAEDGTAIGVRW